jgi:hypothetical protein
MTERMCRGNTGKFNEPGAWCFNLGQVHEHPESSVTHCEPEPIDDCRGHVADAFDLNGNLKPGTKVYACVTAQGYRWQATSKSNWAGLYPQKGAEAPLLSDA